ncbi:MAG: type II toxin-antitoxin system RelE/ParE family toxin [Bacteroidetes bacterium]|nr:MAG: type II toxin-antitoxin system RelE/ParE family toxin [Bacteroidota bacterium]
MKIVVKGSFNRDIDKVRGKEIRHSLDNKIGQIEKARSISNITGVILLEGYSHHYRIIVKSKNYSYRIGAIIRGETIWMVRFLPRRIIYKSFP